MRGPVTHHRTLLRSLTARSGRIGSVAALAACLASAPQGQGLTLFVLDDVARVDLELLMRDGRAPHFARIAAEGFYFTNAHAMPICQPSRRSMEFGDYWVGLAATGCRDRRDPEAPPLEAVSLAERVGVRSLYVGKWHEGGSPIDGNWTRAPQLHGWGNWRAGVAGIVTACGGLDYSTWFEIDNGSAGFVHVYQPRAQLDRWLAWYPGMRGPKLAVFATPLAHSPFHTPPADWLPPGYPQPVTERQQYEAMIVAADMALGQMLAALEPSDSLVIVGDNGTPAAVAGTTKCKGTTFRRGIEVPLMLWGPAIPRGSSAALVHVSDLYQTIAELFGVPEDPTKDGRSLLPLMTGAVERVHEFVLSGTVGHSLYSDDVAVRSLRYKLRRLEDGTEEFYDLLVDPEENVNRILEPAYAARVQRHRFQLEAEMLDAQ